MAAGTSSYGWRFDAGRICLDLVATGVGSSGACEQLDRPARLADWLVASGLVPKGTPLTAVDDTWVARFWELRAGIDLLVTAELVGAATTVPWTGSTHSRPCRPPACGPYGARAACSYGR